MQNKEICKEFENNTFEEIFNVLKNRNENVMTADLIACTQWIISVI